MASLAPEHLFGYRLRREQRRILAYRGGRMAVSAVPGSGKTLTLSLLGARLIVEGLIGTEGEVLVVTVQNSAVANIGQRIRGILEAEGLPPVGFRVCTLHKLAADILRQRHDLAGTEDAFVIVDDAERGRLIARAVDTWRARNRGWWESHLPENHGGRRPRLERDWREQTIRVAGEVAKLAKHLRLSPHQARGMLSEDGDDMLRMGVELYALYAEYLQVRGGLDFDDLIWRALDALGQDATFLSGLQRHWPYILEDEAQDSSPLQEHILDRLAGPHGNWVRVGDPNQSINSTFTAADPRYFRRFLGAENIVRLDLPQSGRCAPPIMELANHLVRRTRGHHPEEALRRTAFEPQEMVCTEAGDPQPNPPSEECVIRIDAQGQRDVEDEARRAVEPVRWYLERHPEGTCAILCPTAAIGTAVVAALDGAEPPVPYDDLLTSSPQLRSVAALLAGVFDGLCRRTMPGPLVRLYGLLVEGGHLGGPREAKRNLRQTLTVLRSVAPARLLFPLESVRLADAIPPHVPLEGADMQAVERFAALVSRWMRATGLPPDQLLLTIAQDLFCDETDLALCHALASNLRSLADTHPEWRLEQHRDELSAVARNRRGLGLALADGGYVDQPGRVVVTTMHKAKGLEWDLVLLMGVTDLEFPGTCEDAFRDEPYFMPGRAPAVEARKRMEQLAGAEFACPPDVDLITAARLEYIAERLRLLYVGITRAKRYLLVSHHRSAGRRTYRPAWGLLALQEFCGQRGRRRT